MTNEERIDRALEGLLSADEWEQLQRDVLADPQLRELYAERAWLHGQLQAEKQLLPSLLDSSPAESRVVETNFWRPLRWAAAAAVVAALVTATIRTAPKPETVATLVEAADCRWAGSDLPTAQGSHLGTGTLALVEGMATLEFESGARVTLEAPSTLEVLSKMHCRLVEGSVVADVPEPAHGFTIDAPEVKVVDLGTKFGVTASRFGNSHVIVFDGEVEVERGGSGEAKRLTTGNTMHIGHQPILANQEISRNPEPSSDRDGWISLTTATGQGKDAYVRRGDSHGPTGKHPLIMVKHTDLAAGNERRALVTFDLTEVPDSRIEDVEFTLDVEASGLGFSALVPDSLFEVHGLTDAADAWSEAKMKWADTPAFNDAGLLAGQSAKLGEFRIRRGHVPAGVSVSSSALRDFVQQDGNRFITFAIVRVTGENDKQGLVHAFASKEHPTAQPPTLHLKISNP